MADIDRYRSEDRSAVEALYLRVFGDAAVESFRKRWDWLYARNPNLQDGSPLIWLSREGSTIVGQFATIPVKLSVNGEEIDAAWGIDVMIAPERQGYGLGRVMFEAFDQQVGAPMGLSLTDASYALYMKLKWHDMGRVPRLAKPLSRAVLDDWGGSNRQLEAAKMAWSRAASRLPLLGGRIRQVDHFDDSFTKLWERMGAQFAFAVRRDATYLNWRYRQAPHMQYSIAALERNGETAGFVVIRHAQEARWKVTLIVDFLADPRDPSALNALLRWVDREAARAGSDLVRVHATHAGFGETLRNCGYRVGKPAVRFVAKINAVSVPDNFYDSADRWHVTLGDSDAEK